MKFKTSSTRRMALAIASGLGLAGGLYGPSLQAADHRDSFAVDAIPEGDLTDVFAYVDPANNNNVILTMSVNPFLNPNEGPSLRFGSDLLYQFKIDNSQANGALEDQVIQVNFSGGATDHSPQTYSVVMGTPRLTGSVNERITGNTLCSGAKVFLGSSNAAGSASTTPTRQGAITPGVGGVTCFAGVEDDSFQTDVAQAVFRVGLDPNPATNANNHTQDVFRGYGGTGSLIGGLRGRPIRADGTSGVDGFGGYDTTVVSISIPKNLIRGAGIPNVAKGGAVDPSLVGIWATVSRPVSETFDGLTSTGNTQYAQFERMGQQLTNTVFIFAQPPTGSKKGPLTYADAGFPGTPTTKLSNAEMKDFFNSVGPEKDVALFDRFYPDSLTTTPTAGSPGTGGLLGGLLGGVSGKLLGANTITGRAALLTVLGFNSYGITGTPLLTTEAGLTGNTNRRLLAQLTFPDYMRLNLDTATDGVRPGAAAAGDNSPTLAIGQWGLQNGRRPADDVTDIVLRLNRELDDVLFPSSVVLPGIADAIPGSGPIADRAALACTQLNVAGGLTGGAVIGNLLQNLTDPTALTAKLAQQGSSDGLTGLYTLNVLTPCEDARIFVVLQGTDWIETNPLDVINVANQVSDQRTPDAVFPYLGFNPVPGEAGSSDFPPQK